MKSEIIFTKSRTALIPECAGKAFRKSGNAGFAALFGVALIVVILAVYMQAGNHQFLNFDDDVYVTENPHVAGGITGQNITWAFTSVDAGNWHPVTWLSHMIDARFFGMDPRGHHLTNVVIHTLSALLLFMLLLRLTGARWQSLFVAALFALHPLHVESVAWVAERKDLLSALFWFFTLLLYAEYAAKRKPVFYALSLFSFVLGLMSKPMLVTLPVVMLLMDLWPLDRYRHRDSQEPHQLSGRLASLIKEKIPFIICSLFSGLITIYAQHKGGAIHGLTEISFRLRMENALTAYVTYIGKTLWPHNLAVFYPFPSSIPLWQVIGSLFILLLVSAAAIRTVHRHPYLAVGWCWYLVTLLPVIGLIQVGGQSMADRYTYLPLTGLFIMAAWGVPDLARGIRHRQVICALFACAALIASAATTWQQLGYWRDNISLYRHTLQVTAVNPGINFNLGIALQAKGDLDAAIEEFRQAAEKDPRNATTRNSLGASLDSKGYLDAAIREYQEALRISPDYAMARSNLEFALSRKRHLDAMTRQNREKPE